MVRWYLFVAAFASSVVACSSGSGPSAAADAGTTSDSGAAPVDASDSGAAPEDAADSGVAPADAGGDAQTPPQGAAALDGWLATGGYKAWHCEAAVHAQRPPSPHGFVRTCSNDVIASNATGTGPWPVGAAAVKEVYGSATEKTPMGYSVYLKTQTDSAAGANWYWYAKGPSGVMVDGLGSADGPKAMCVSCHVNAGTDAAHTPSPGARDEVYSPVH